MSREKMFDPLFIRQFTESIIKENSIRMKWHLEYASQFERIGGVEWDAPADDDDDLDDEMRPMETPATKKREEQVKKPVVPPPEEEDDEWTRPSPFVKFADIPAAMKPAPAHSKTLLYQGISHDGEGRIQYLRHRLRHDPEDKYIFPMLSSWEYGWRYGEPGDTLKAPDHGHYNIIQHSFFRPNDPQIKPRDNAEE